MNEHETPNVVSIPPHPDTVITVEVLQRHHYQNAEHIADVIKNGGTLDTTNMDRWARKNLLAAIRENKLYPFSWK